MSSLITARTVFEATIGLLVNKGRNKLAEKLNEGDVTDQKSRGLIVLEIDKIKSKLDGLARNDLLASISLFKEGIELFYDVFESARSSSERLRARLGKEERREIICKVCFFNRVVYDLTLMARGFGTKGQLSVNWPCVNTGEEPVNPLRNQRVAEVLNEQGMVHCSCLPWSLGQEGEEEHKLKRPRGIATNIKNNS
ncbi:unnamed protein product [Porites lobata]|uniref:Uncharacterized protein n=1 Tax=Porites lobata TaxID=104759 RepID=A0ABN8P545_9CNID|nr:unnamed protein product [Porites lobata]